MEDSVIVRVCAQPSGPTCPNDHPNYTTIMKSMFSQSITVAAMLAGSCAATNPLLDSLLARQDINPTYKGCFSSAGSLKLNGTATWQSKKNCYEVCSPLGFSVEATADANACWCGNALPPNADLVSDSQCNLNCTGYPAELCRFTDAMPWE